MMGGGRGTTYMAGGHIQGRVQGWDKHSFWVVAASWLLKDEMKETSAQ